VRGQRERAARAERGPRAQRRAAPARGATQKGNERNEAEVRARVSRARRGCSSPIAGRARGGAQASPRDAEHFSRVIDFEKGLPDFLAFFSNFETRARRI
jgi:hypothetical protein